MTMVTIAHVTLLERGLAGLRIKVDALNKRAARHGMDTLAVRVTREFGFVPVSGGRFGRSESLFSVDIDGISPRIEGWTIAARVEFNDTVGNVVRIAPGRRDDGSYRAYRTVGPVCEHCNTNRRRNDIFVLEDIDGDRKIVGRNCLADFLRREDADDLARFAEYCDLINDAVHNGGEDCYEEGHGVGVARVISIDRFLSVSAMLIRQFGWSSKNNDAGNVSTAERAVEYLCGRGSRHADWIEKNELYVCDADEALAVRAADWVCSIGDDCNEYLNTLRSIVRSGGVDMGSLVGYAASLIPAYQKDCSRRAEKAACTVRKVWYGEPKKRERNVSVTCVGVSVYEGYYGLGTVVRFEVAAGGDDIAVCVWFASGNKAADWEIGTDYTVDFTCKGHDECDKYGKQTKINRVKDVS